MHHAYHVLDAPLTDGQ